MRRRQWIEIHDQTWCPESLRDVVTDTLQFLWNLLDFYGPIVPRLRLALQEAGTHQVLDLCSGGGGPWLRLVRDFESNRRFPANICLTDKFPNPRAFEHTQGMTEMQVVFCSEPVDATSVPPKLRGFRTVFSSFHHFPPERARAILQGAVDQQQGVGIFEAPKRDWLTILLTCFLPVASVALVPFIRPFRWSRLFWTYLIPALVFVIWFDGVVSCMRAYSPSELLELTNGLAPNGYHWETGEDKHTQLPITITYLIGYPIQQAANQTLSSESCGDDPSI
jgi:hypothetical protein